MNPITITNSQVLPFDLRSDPGRLSDLQDSMRVETALKLLDLLDQGYTWAFKREGAAEEHKGPALRVQEESLSGVPCWRYTMSYRAYPVPEIPVEMWVGVPTKASLPEMLEAFICRKWRSLWRRVRGGKHHG